MSHSSGYVVLLVLAPAAKLLVRWLAQFLDLPNRLARWHRALGYIWVPGVVMFLAAGALNIKTSLVGDAYWVLVLAVLALALGQVNYRPARTLLVAGGPWLLYNTAEFVVKLFGGQSKKGDDGGFWDAAQGFVILWLIAFILIARSQKKNLEKERVQREEDERAKRLIETQNAELERLVAERTAALTRQAEELRGALTELRATQAQLVQSEKMASLGELTAGIAHEIQNPLNFVNNFADVSVELLDELREEQARPARDPGLETDLLADIAQNLHKIHHHGQRAASIVKGMLEHSRVSSGERRPTDLNQLADEYLRLAYQGLRAKDKSFNATLVSDFAPDLPAVAAIGPDLGRVLLNLFGNAFYAVRQRQLRGEAGYVPTVAVRTLRRGEHVEIRVRDNGLGIPEGVRQKIFQPFFTTKPSGEGTGLGLSLSYDIVTQGHGGTLTVESEEGNFTEFLISLPLNQPG